jgi:hypothetical protein
MRDIRFGASAGKTNTFEIAIGLMNSHSATNLNYYRGAGVSSTYGVRNLVEWNFFPDDGYGATWATTVVSTNNRILPAHNIGLELTTGDLYHITLSYAASNQTLRTSATKNGAPYGLSPDNALQSLILTTEPDFRLDAFSITSYSDAVQIGTPDMWGSILAHGTVDNVTLVVPDPVPGTLGVQRVNSNYVLTFASRTNWIYALEKTTNFGVWSLIVGPTNGTGGNIGFSDSSALQGIGFYRVRADRP